MKVRFMSRTEIAYFQTLVYITIAGDNTPEVDKELAEMLDTYSDAPRMKQRLVDTTPPEKLWLYLDVGPESVESFMMDFRKAQARIAKINKN